MIVTDTSDSAFTAARDARVEYQAQKNMDYCLRYDDPKSAMQTILVAKKAAQEAIVKELQSYKDRQIACSKQAAAETGNGVNSALGQHLARIDARTYYRWQKVDKNFWHDRKNVEKYLQANPEADLRKFRR